MALKNNKGFSLIEIIIAIAVLTLLLTPIMKQFAQTLQTSRLAKEQQYINEEAIYTLEKAQVSTDKQLAAEYGSPTDAVDISCSLVDINGDVYDGGSAVIKYNEQTYSLGQVEVGARKTVYNKAIVVDDIAAQVRGYKNALGGGYSIKYGLTEADIAGGSFDGFEITSEGSAVHYNGSGQVDKVVCVPREYTGNPNDINLGNMQNIDVNTVALVDGITARFDDQADKALYAYAMDKLKEVDYSSWDQIVNHADGDGLYTQAGYTNLINKLTKFYIDKGTDANGKYYYVQADVYYQCSFTLNGTEYSTDLKYNVLSQTFYMDECPNIFFEYQPYINNMTYDGTSYEVEYAKNDYVLIENYVDDVKLYMYKPYKDAYSVANNVQDADYEVGIYKYVSRTPNASGVGYTETPVKIHLSDINSSTKKTTVITNLNIAENFVCDAVSGSVFTSLETQKPGETLLVEDFVDEDGTEKYLINLADDKRTNDRLKTVTVTMAPDTVNGNTVSLTGAKGEK